MDRQHSLSVTSLKATNISLDISHATYLQSFSRQEESENNGRQ